MKKYRVLICEDDEGISDVAQIVLSEAGYEVKVVDKKKEILNLIKTWQPHLILLDLWMPEASGEEIIRMLKSNSTFQNIPIIIVSASKDTEKIAIAAGANDFLSKPFDISDLEQKVAFFCK
jgi:DNA-binding response OmpR family regulator